MRIYVAGPITVGDQFNNVRAALDAGDELMAYGHVPFIPHLTCFWHMVIPREYEDWMGYDDVWLRQCEGLLRITGMSAGADREVERAKELGLPVFLSVDEVNDYAHSSHGT